MGNPVKPSSVTGQREKGISGFLAPRQRPGTILCCLLRVSLTNPRRRPMLRVSTSISTATFREERWAFPGIHWDSQPWFLRGSFCHKKQIEGRPQALAEAANAMLHHSRRAPEALYHLWGHSLPPVPSSSEHRVLTRPLDCPDPSPAQARVELCLSSSHSKPEQQLWRWAITHWLPSSKVSTLELLG